MIGIMKGSHMNTERIIENIISLPLEERIHIVESLLKDIRESRIDEEWGALAQKRLDEMRRGKVKPIPGDEVFGKIRERFDY